MKWIIKIEWNNIQIFSLVSYGTAFFVIMIMQWLTLLCTPPHPCCYFWWKFKINKAFIGAGADIAIRDSWMTFYGSKKLIYHVLCNLTGFVYNWLHVGIYCLYILKCWIHSPFWNFHISNRFDRKYSSSAGVLYSLWTS